MGSVSRRRFLQLGAGVAAATALGTSCADDRRSVDTDRDGIPDDVETTTTAMSNQKRQRLSDVQHVVVIMAGGSSYDQVFGTRRKARGFDDPDATRQPTGKPIWYQPDTTNPDGYTLPFPMATAGPDAPCFPGIAGGWTAQHNAWSNGRMDRYAEQMGPLAMGYLRRADLPWYHALADEFTLCGAWHSSVMGPANPNRIAALSGTIDPLQLAGGPAVDNLGTRYGWETYPERLLRAGIGWRAYGGPDAHAANALRTFVQFEEARPTDELWDAAMRDRDVEQFEADCASNDLPWVSWVALPDVRTPAGGLPVLGQQELLARHVRAVMANTDLWQQTMIIITHDTSGGYFDHVAPPTPIVGPAESPLDYVGADPIGLGARVPAMVVSPWSRGGGINDTVVDHTSILRLLEHRFGVEANLISPWRREATGDLLDTLDLDAYDPSVPVLPAPLPVPARTEAQCDATIALWPGPPVPQSPPATEA